MLVNRAAVWTALGSVELNQTASFAGSTPAASNRSISANPDGSSGQVEAGDVGSTAGRPCRTRCSRMAATLGGALRRAHRRTSGDTGGTVPAPVGTRLQRVDAADGRDVDITSPANPRVKWLQSLRRRRVRDEERVTVVEGYAELALALEAGVRPRLLVTCPEIVDEAERPLADRARAAGAEVVTLEQVGVRQGVVPGVAGRLAGRRTGSHADPDRPRRGARAPLRRASRLSCWSARRSRSRATSVPCCARPRRPGVDAVIAASPVADWGNPNVVRASKGTVFAVPIAAAAADEVIGWLRGHGLHIVVATPDAEREVPDVDLTGPTAVVVGAEHDGVTAGWFDPGVVGPDVTAARLPMVGRVNSLNVATSAALVLYEITRQRR